MLAVGADDVVIVLQRGERAHRHGFLSDVQMAEAADLAEGVRLGGFFLEAPNEQHLPQHLQMQLGLGRDGGSVLGGSGGGRHAVAASTCSQA